MRIYYVTLNSSDEASRISRALLEQRLAVCTNWFPITCAYREEEKIVEEAETGICSSRLTQIIVTAVEQLILETHWLHELYRGDRAGIRQSDLAQLAERRSSSRSGNGQPITGIRSVRPDRARRPGLHADRPDPRRQPRAGPKYRQYRAWHAAGPASIRGS